MVKDSRGQKHCSSLCVWLQLAETTPFVWITETGPHWGRGRGSIEEDLVHVLDRRRGRQPAEEAWLAETTPASAAPPRWLGTLQAHTSPAGQGAFLSFVSRLPAWCLRVPKCHSHHSTGMNAIFWAYFPRRINTYLSLQIVRVEEQAAMESPNLPITENQSQSDEAVVRPIQQSKLPEGLSSVGF